MSVMMKAVQFHAAGGPDVLRYEDVPRPEVVPGEVLVRVHAVGLNPPDWYLREGYAMLPPEWQPKLSFPVIPGTDLSGVVEAVGEGVTGFAEGDAVYAMVRFPSGLAGGSRAYAEYVSVPAAQLAHRPAGIDHVQAAAAPMSALTAWQFLVSVGHTVQNPLQPHPHEPVPLDGRTVLVNGAAGGVGHLALQIAKRQGAQVIAVASGRHAAMLRALGADQVIDYMREKAQESVGEVDLVVDAVGGAASRRFLACIRPGGALFPIFPLGFDGAEEAERRGITVSTTQVRSSGAQLEEIGALLNTGALRVLIDSTFPLSEAAAAHRRAAEGHLQGKIVLTVA
ncbi:NADP-dependent oxidoreductase [Rhizobium sp. YIM 134829]|uniref:NADP-dependent oxidoreductase n=1 Tax=Rhizobium sp. YIM 134829 TaxID=3390453 RepID=UPI00397B97AC